MTDEQIQEGIDKARNLNRIKTAIEVIREHERYNNYQVYDYEYETLVPHYYPIHKDLHGVESILVNDYIRNLSWVYWLMYSRISNHIQKSLYENKERLQELEIVVDNIEELKIPKQEDDIHEEVNYIERRHEIKVAFKKMIEWLFTKPYNPTFEREAYWSGFLKNGNKTR